MSRAFARAVLFSLACILPAASAVAGADPSFAEEPRLDHRHHGDPRYMDRRAHPAPPGSSFDEIPGGVETLAFSEQIDDIVKRLTLFELDERLQELSGWRPVLVGGEPHTFVTRHALSEGGRIASQFAYEQLEALGLDVRLQEFVWGGNHMFNVIATIPGTVTPERVYVLGGHLDSISPIPHELAPGAEDNGSGSAAVMAAARALVGERFQSTIELVLFNGEELGLWGSEFYVEQALDAGVDLRAAVIVDMIAYYGDDYGVLIEGEQAWSGLMQSFASAVDAYTDLGREFSYHSYGSDHVPFQDAGIPAVLGIDLDWNEYPHYHQTTDTYDKTTPEMGVEIGRAALATIAQLAGPVPALSTVEEVALSLAAPLRVVPNPARGVAHVTLEAVANDATGLSVHSADGGAIGESRSMLEIIDPAGRSLRRLYATDTGGAVRWSWPLDDGRGVKVAPGVYWARCGGAATRIVVVR